MSDYKWSGLRVGTAGISVNAEIEAEKVVSVVAKVQKKNNGICNATDLVEASRSKSSPTHKMFEWDDSIAGPKYREEQARLILRTVRVEYLSGDGEKKEVRAFSRVARDDKGNGFAKTIDAMEDPDDRDYILNQSLAGLRAWRRRWNELNDVAAVAKAVQYVDLAIDEIRTAVAETV